jgi:ankyrin repeat protein
MSTVVNKGDGMGRTALLLASEEGHDEVIGALLAAGADPNCKDQYDRTPLSLACEACHWASVTILLDGGATVVTGEDAASASMMADGAREDDQSDLADRIVVLVPQ